MSEVLLDIEGPVATITLNRPDRLNAITAEVVEALRAHLEDIFETRAIRAVVLTGAGRAFCAGGDLARLKEPDQDSIEEAVATARRLMWVTALLRNGPKPVIAAVNGAAAGAGLSLACAADLRLAADNAFFAAAFLRAGRAGDYGLAWTLPRIVGDGAARRMMLLGERFKAADAMKMGLVSEVVSAEDVMAKARAWALALSEFSPVAVAGMKANLNAASVVDLESYLEGEAERHIEVSRGPEAGEAITAMMEKRRPDFELPSLG